MATMQALVIGVERNRLLVLDFSTRRRVIVNTPSARRFHRGDIVRIRYNGVMTASIPPPDICAKYFCDPKGNLLVKLVLKAHKWIQTGRLNH